MPCGTPQYLTIFECDKVGASCEYCCKVVIGPHPQEEGFRKPSQCPYNSCNSRISWYEKILEVK